MTQRGPAEEAGVFTRESLDLVFQNKQETWLLETAQICIKTCRFWILRWPNGDIQEP
jgi:hypothetical protein